MDSRGFFHRVLAEHGVELYAGEELERFEGADGRVRRVVTKGGRELDCDFVVIGAGVQEVTLARAAGLDLGEAGGVPCSSGLETSAPGIFAAGDICGTTAPCMTGRCGSSIGTSRSTRARPPHSTCSAGRGARHGAVLLLRPRGLVVDGVRRPGAARR